MIKRIKKAPKTQRTYTKVFKNLKKKAEMLSQRKAGRSYVDLARHYGVDHTTIIYHCEKAGLLVFSDIQKRNEMLQKVIDGQSIEDVSILYEVPRTMIESYCIRAGIKGMKVQTSARLTPVGLSGPKRRMIAREKQYKKYRKFKGPSEKTEAQRKEEKEEIKKIKLEKLRVELLTY